MNANGNVFQRQFLTFPPGNEIVALDIVKVREVLELTTVSEIPRTPDYIKGVMSRS